MDATMGAVAARLLDAIGWIDPVGLANCAAAFMRTVGPYFPEHRVGRENLKAAFPEKPAAEIEAILLGVWDNLGRFAAEFAHLERLWADDRQAGPERVAFGQKGLEIFEQLRSDGKPALIFAAHLANWEIPALAAAALGFDSTVLFRLPNLGGLAEAIVGRRLAHMGQLIRTGPDAPFRLARALDAGSHVGMLVDQHYTKGVDVMFFDRPCKANPLLARLARHYDCPVHGVRIIRIGNGQFRGEVTDPIEVPRDPDGRVNIQGTMQTITAVVEQWVREYPEQWLWLHRRWR
ncbi:MAG TPA: lipid A biosynthesis lauroyl acyltransferase [Xanthobacteraceae bacterium]|nr:lipid A biosynthesis lauroyl acyltransferase [Xanthobacteraceae bacterium]